MHSHQCVEDLQAALLGRLQGDGLRCLRVETERRGAEFRRSSIGGVTGPGKKSNVRWAVCGLLFLITTVNYMDRSALGLVEPILRHLLGGDTNLALYNRHYGDIVTCFVLAYGLGYPFAGWVIDRVGARRGLALSIGVWAAASISHAFARTVTGFGAARFALGLGESGNMPAALKATADWFAPEERALATGIFNAGTSAASLLAPFIIPLVAVRYGWQAAFFTTGGLSLTWLVCWLLFPYNRLQRKYGASAAAITTAAAATVVGRRSYGELLRTRATWAFALSKACTDPVWWFYLFWLPKFLNERFAVNMSQLGPPLIIVYAGATVGSIGGGWLAGYFIRCGMLLRAGRRRAMLICAVCAMAVILVPFAHLLWQAIGLLCMATAAHQGWSSNLFSTPSDMFASDSVGSVVGIGGAIGSLSSTVFTTLVGILWTHHALPIFFVSGFAYLFSVTVFQSRRFAG
jgi:ACS family hexuronate transporter-like MFS transporter